MWEPRGWALRATFRALQPGPSRGCCCSGSQGPEAARVRGVISPVPGSARAGHPDVTQCSLSREQIADPLELQDRSYQKGPLHFRCWGLGSRCFWVTHSE